MNKKLTLLAILLIGFSSAFAQSTANATATATLVAPIAISKTADMSFGNVAASGTAGTVVLAPNGSRSTTGGATLPATIGSVTAAGFNITGEGTSTYAITLPETHELTNTGDGTTKMTVDTFTSTPSGTGTLTAGAQSITVGATLNVGVNQAAGTYENATGFDVTVNYN